MPYYKILLDTTKLPRDIVRYITEYIMPTYKLYERVLFELLFGFVLIEIRNI